MEIWYDLKVVLIEADIIVMFEKFLYSNMVTSKPSYNQLLQKPETNLMQVIDEDGFVSEFKTGSQKIKDFMTYQRFVELTELVTVVGPETQKKRSYKFPLTACEMLSSDNTKIQQYFLPSNGVVIIEQKVTKCVQIMTEQQIDDDEEDGNEQNQDDSKSAQKIAQNNTPIEAGEADKKQNHTQKTQGETQQFGQFVQAPPKPKKKVMVKEVVQTTQIVNRQYPALIELLFNYFANPINHTLTGYVCKILLNFTNKKTAAIFSRLFQNPTVTDNLFDHVFTHIGSRSTVQWIVRLLTIQNRTYIAQRYELLNKLIRTMNNAEGVEDLSNLAACFCESYDKLSAHFKTPNPIKQLQVYNQKIPQLLKKITQLVLSDREDVATYSVQVFGHLFALLQIKDGLSDFPQLLTQYLPGTVKRLKFILSQQRSKLGLLPVKVLQTYNSALRAKNVSLWFKEKQNNVFPTLFALVKKYAFNNIFHNEVFKFIQNCINSSVIQLSAYVVNQSGLLQWLEQEAQTEQARVKGPKRGYAQHIVNFCKFMKEQAKKNGDVQDFTKDARFLNVWNVLVDKEIISSQKLLGGYSKKQTKHRIMHSKEGILAAHATFLAATPAPVQQLDLQDPLQNEELLKQLQRQLDGIQQAPEPRPEEVIAQQQHKAELIEQNQHHKGAFWKVHLDYNIDNLIEQLV